MANWVINAAALALAALGAAACDRGPATSSEYNNSGASAAVAMPGSATSNATQQPVNPPPNIRAADIQHDTTPPAPAASPDQSQAAAAAPQGAAPADTASAAPQGAASADTAVATQVKSAIAGDSALADADVKVDAQGGVVTLSGSAKSAEQAQRVAELAQRQQGVTRVENRLAVR